MLLLPNLFDLSERSRVLPRDKRQASVVSFTVAPPHDPPEQTQCQVLDSKTHRNRRVNMIRIALGNDLRRHRTDAGLSLGAVAGGADISRSHLCELETGKADASLPTLTALAGVLGADLSIRLYPNTGPRIRDHIQARIVEELLRVAHARWHTYTEVPVYRPARGRVDIVYHDPAAVLMVASEVHSQINRVEQQLGWANLKVDLLPSADLWRLADARPGREPASRSALDPGDARTRQPV